MATGGVQAPPWAIDPITKTPVVGGSVTSPQGNVTVGSLYGGQDYGKTTSPVTPQQAETKAMQQASQGLPQGQSYTAKGALVGAKPGQNSGNDVLAMQKFLNAHGANLKEDGILGPQTKAAAEAWRNRFNTKPSSTSPAPSGKGTPPASATAPANTAGRNPAGSPPGGSPPPQTDPLTALIASLNPNVGTMLDPKAYGNIIAGAQYDPSIYMDRIGLNRAPVQAKQDMADIGNWYNQALQSMVGAGKADATQNTAEQGSMGDAVAKIISSLGGSANQGSGLVGAAGADQIGNLAALGHIDQSFHNDMNPLMQAEAASALTNQKNLENTHVQDLQHQLASDLGARGQTAAADSFNAVGQNNQLAQQRYGNKFGIMQAIESAQISGQNAQAKEAAAQATNTLNTAKANAYIHHLGTQDAFTQWKMNHPSSKATGFAALINKGYGSRIQNDAANILGYSQQDVANGLVGADKLHTLRPEYLNKDGSKNWSVIIPAINNQIRQYGFHSDDAAARSYRDLLLKSMFGITPPKAWENNW